MEPEAACAIRHEHHADDRRPAGAAGDLHGSVAAVAKGLDVDLPAETTASPSPSDTQIVIEYLADRRLAINKQDVTLPALESRLREIFATRRDKTLYIAGAGSLRYGDIVAVVDAGKGAGVERVGIITEGMRQ